MYVKVILRFRGWYYEWFFPRFPEICRLSLWYFSTFKMKTYTYSQTHTKVGDWLTVTNEPAVKLRQEARYASKV